MPPAPRTARALARAELTRAILDRAGVQLAEVGPAALSVRQVARDLEMASSAVYRYFPSRDALLTALIVRAYDDLGEAVEDGDGRAARFDLRGRGSGCAHGLETGPWRTRTSTPCSTAPPCPGTPPRRHRRGGHAGGTGTARPDADAKEAGCSPVAPIRPVTKAERAATAPSVRSSAGLGEECSVRGLMAWATLFGNISLELFGHMPGASSTTRRTTSRWSTSSPPTSASDGS